MKKSYLFAIVFCFALTTNAQFLNWGIKGGVNYNSNGDLTTLSSGSSDDILETFSSNEEVGYHFGLLTEIKLPLFLYIRPELIYTHTESSYQFDNGDGKLKMDKLELPLLVGFRVFKIGRFFFGPNFSYIIDTKLSAPENIKDVDYDDFTVSGQVGLGLNFGKIGADIRWETGFTDSQASFINDNLVPDNTDFNFGYADTSHSQFILSFYYKFK